MEEDGDFEILATNHELFNSPFILKKMTFLPPSPIKGGEEGTFFPSSELFFGGFGLLLLLLLHLEFLGAHLCLLHLAFWGLHGVVQ